MSVILSKERMLVRIEQLLKQYSRAPATVMTVVGIMFPPRHPVSDGFVLNNINAEAKAAFMRFNVLGNNTSVSMAEALEILFKMNSTMPAAVLLVLFRMFIDTP